MTRGETLGSCLVILLATFVVGRAADAAIVPVAQSRSVSATAFAEDSSGSDSDADGTTATTFDPFDAAAAATVLLPGAIGSGTGEQCSSFHPGSIDASGQHSANGEGWESGAYGSGAGASNFEITFDLTEDSDYTITGFLEEFDNGSTSLLLTGSSGTIHALFPPSNDQLIVSESGHLPAGTYTLEVRTSGSAFGDEFFFDYSSGAYDITFEIPIATSSPLAAVAGGIVASPNPCRLSTTIEHGSMGAADVTIHDLAGRLVRRLSTPGGSRPEWDTRDQRGRRVPAGVYFVNVATEREHGRTKVTVLR